MTRALALGLLVACGGLAACGDDGPPAMATPDGGPTADAMPDAPVEETTFTTYVIDLVTAGTSDTAAPRPYIQFGTLADPDGDANNTSAFAPLF